MMSDRHRTRVHGTSVLALLGALLLPAIQSCGDRNEADTEPRSVDSLQEHLAELDREAGELQRQKEALDEVLNSSVVARWEVDADGYLKAVQTFGEGGKTPAELVALLNSHRDRSSRLPNPVMEFVRVEDSTVYVRLQHGERLTRQMGSAGAAQYLAEATYTLTSLPDINRIHLEFEEGDHAAPGYYVRADWVGVFEVSR